jgi:hypothetical protein
VTTQHSTSGSSTFTYTLNALSGSTGTTTWTSVTLPADGEGFYALYGENPQGTRNNSIFSSLSLDSSSLARVGAGKTFTTGTTYDFTVNWTVASGTNPTLVNFPDLLHFSFGLKDPNNNIKATMQEISFNIEPTAVPEPPQTLAGSVVVGCGLLLGIGRRLFKKPLV